MEKPEVIDCEPQHTITEGQATISTRGKVFYNPVQEFNRDLSISVLNTFAADFLNEPTLKAGVKQENGLRILEALSATGLRSIRYAKEVQGVSEIVANDISYKAVEDIQRNVTENHVEHLVTASRADATMLMYQHREREKTFHALDLDPYGCPAVFLDGAVQCVKDGGLLLVTATDMAILAGNSPETCYVKYGAVSLKSKACHEMALRILLQCLEAHANRYGRFITPLLSISVDFYIRVFVRIETSPKKCKQTLSKLNLVYLCTGCGSFVLRPLGITKKAENNRPLKFGLPTRSPDSNCTHCDHSFHIGGPVWGAELHDGNFVTKLLAGLSPNLGTFKRLLGVLSMVKEELAVPLYYTVEQLTSTIHVETPPMNIIRSALLNAGYAVSYTHANKTGIKTDAPAEFLWDVMKTWEKTHPVNEKRIKENAPGTNILKKPIVFECSLRLHPGAKPESVKSGVMRFQMNPAANWGPGTRATAMIGDTLEKRVRNQNKKRKREDASEEGDSK